MDSAMRRTVSLWIAGVCFTVIVPTVVAMMWPSIDPSLGWSIIGVSGIIGAVAALSAVSERVQTSSPPLVPDWPIRSLFFHIDPDVLEEDGGPHWEAVERDVLNRLSTGQLHSWGERDDGGGRPLTPIPQDFWGTATLTHTFYEEGERHEQLVHAHSNVRGSRRISYRNIRFNKAEALKIWSPRKPLDVSDLALMRTAAFTGSVLLLLVLAAGSSELWRLWNGLFSVPDPRPLIDSGVVNIGNTRFYYDPTVTGDKVLVQVPIQNKTAPPQGLLVTTTQMDVFVNEELQATSSQNLAFVLKAGEQRYIQRRIAHEKFAKEPSIVVVRFTIEYGAADQLPDWRLYENRYCTMRAKPDFSGNCVTKGASLARVPQP